LGSRGVDELKCAIQFDYGLVIQPFISELLRMKRYFGFSLAAVAALFLLGCIGSGGNSAPPPTNVTVIAKDTRAVLTWNMSPGVEYWLYKAAGTGVTPGNCSKMSLCTTTVKVTSPVSIWGLYNATEYSFSINGRTNGGPGGAGSTAVVSTPRLGGAAWSTGATTVTGSSDLRGVVYGASGAKYVATGMSGALYSGIVYTGAAGDTGITWTAMTNPIAPATHFYGVNYDAAHAKFLAVGTGGAVIAHTPASSATAWTQLTSNTGNDLYAITNNGAGFNVATGASGAIITSSDGVAWTLQTSGTGNALNAVTYGYDSTNARYVFVAVGAAGTVLYSIDAVTWTPATASGTWPNLRGVTYGLAAGVFVAVGDGGTVLTSPDAITWTLQAATTIPSSTQLNAVTYSTGRRFIAVANDGNIYYNEYSNAGVAWTAVAPQATTAPLHAVTTGALFDYSIVGGSGINLYAD
jgi:hypothetical protein